MSGNYIYKTKSKSRTFKKNGDPGEFIPLGVYADKSVSEII